MSEIVSITLSIEIILKERNDSRFFPMSIPTPNDIDTVEELMAFATHWVLGDIDTVGANRMVLTDSKNNNHIILIDQIQGISIYAPEALPDSLGWEPDDD